MMAEYDYDGLYEEVKTPKETDCILESPYDCYLHGNISDRQLLYQGKLCDEIDKMMARFLNSDSVGRQIKLPVVRLSKGVYLIGLIRCEISLNKNFRLVVGNNVPLKLLMLKTHQEQLDAIEEVKIAKGQTRNQVIIDKLKQLRASDFVVQSFLQRHGEATNCSSKRTIY